MDQHLKNASLLTYLMENLFQIGNFKIGLSSVIDLVPGIGNIIDTGLSLYLVYIALQMKVPFRILIHMIWNISVNFIIGIIPIVGDAAYILRRANTKNLALLKKFSSAHSNVEIGQII